MTIRYRISLGLALAVLGLGFLPLVFAALVDPPPPSAKWMAGLFGLNLLLGGLSLFIP